MYIFRGFRALCLFFGSKNATTEGLEPPTYSLGNYRSIQLSYVVSRGCDLAVTIMGDNTVLGGRGFDEKPSSRVFVLLKATRIVTSHEVICEGLGVDTLILQPSCVYLFRHLREQSSVMKRALGVNSAFLSSLGIFDTHPFLSAHLTIRVTKREGAANFLCTGIGNGSKPSPPLASPYV